MRDFPSKKQESQETIHHQEGPGHRQLSRKAHANHLVKKTFVVSVDNSSESEEDAEDNENVSMMSNEDDESVFNYSPRWQNLMTKKTPMR